MNREELKNLLIDQIFKYVFMHEEIAREFIKAFSDYLHLYWEYKSVKCDPQYPIHADNIHLKDFYSDSIITLKNGDTVLLEAYSKLGSPEYIKSQAYQDRSSSNQFEKGEKYNNPKMVALINIVKGNYQGGEILDEYKIVSLRTKDAPFAKTNNKPFFVIAVDNIKKINYNEDERFLQIVDLLSSDSMEELKQKAEKRKGDKFMASVVNYADKYLKDEFYNGLGSQLDLQMQKVEARVEKAGMKARMKAGAKSEKLATAKRMLAKGIDLDLTAELTGLSIKVLKS